jgi:putative transposase
MRSRYRINEEDKAHFITATIAEWLPVFTTQRCCEIIVQSLVYCREHRDLRIYSWVVMDNHLHAIVSGPELARVLQSFKRHTATAILEELDNDGRSWLKEQLAFRCRKSRRHAGSEYQVWQQGVHPQSIYTDEVMAQKRNYIHLNPVRRGLVIAPEHCRYSSAHEWLPAAEPVLRVDLWQ